MTAGTVVAEFETALVRTTVLAAAQDDGFTWVRTAGAARSGPLRRAPRDLLAALTAPAPAPPAGRGPGVRCVLPRVYDGAEGLHYPLPGRRSLAELLLSGDPSGPPDDTRTDDMLYGLGRLLRALHAAPLPAEREAGGYALPGAWRRLRSWTGAPADGRPAQLHLNLRELLGSSRWSLVERWSGEPPETGPRTLVHGAPGLGLLIPAETGGLPHGLITGEDAGIAPWQWDVGWVLAELGELRHFSARLHRPGTDWARLEQSFLDGYGRPRDPLVRRCTALRSLLHLHDFCVFVTWDEAEVRRYAALLVDTIDAADPADGTGGVR